MTTKEDEIIKLAKNHKLTIEFDNDLNPKPALVCPYDTEPYEGFRPCAPWIPDEHNKGELLPPIEDVCGGVIALQNGLYPSLSDDLAKRLTAEMDVWFSIDHRYGYIDFEGDDE